MKMNDSPMRFLADENPNDKILAVYKRHFRSLM